MASWLLAEKENPEVRVTAVVPQLMSWGRGHTIVPHWGACAHAPATRASSTKNLIIWIPWYLRFTYT